MKGHWYLCGLRNKQFFQLLLLRICPPAFSGTVFLKRKHRIYKRCSESADCKYNPRRSKSFSFVVNSFSDFKRLTAIFTLTILRLSEYCIFHFRHNKTPTDKIIYLDEKRAMRSFLSKVICQPLSLVCTKEKQNSYFFFPDHLRFYFLCYRCAENADCAFFVFLWAGRVEIWRA